MSAEPQGLWGTPTSTTKQQYLELRESRVGQEMEVARMLEKAGANDGLALLRAIAEARRLEINAWSGLDHDARMSLIEQDNRATETLLAQIRERRAVEQSTGEVVR